MATKKDATIAEVEPIPESLTFLQRLVEAARSIEMVEATGKNAHFSYKFQEEAAVVLAARKALFNYNILFVPEVVESTQQARTVKTSNGERTEFHTHLKMLFHFYDAEDKAGKHLTMQWQSEAIDSGDKGYSKALVAGVKYFLLKALLIPKVGDDPEADPETDTREVAGPPAPATPIAPAPSSVTSTPGGGQGGRPGQAAEAADHKEVREKVYGLCRKHGISVDAVNMRKLASDATQRRIQTLYEVQTGDWWLMHDHILNQYEPIGGSDPMEGDEPPPPTDADLPF